MIYLKILASIFLIVLFTITHVRRIIKQYKITKNIIDIFGGIVTLIIMLELLNLAGVFRVFIEYFKT